MLVRPKPDIVLTPDAARPFVSEGADFSRAIDAASRTGAAIPAIPVTDTIKLTGESGDVEATRRTRARLRIAQTPQAFRFDVMLEARSSRGEGRAQRFHR